ncbi:MAG: hypothetical protein Q8934_16380 [Bacillota bacterium]|nr:hypothetical protein [Bacillota bacterium]
MTNQLEKLKLNSNNWMWILQRVDELRKHLLNIQNGEILFWLDGDWFFKSDRKEFPIDFPPPHFILNKEILGEIDEKNVESVIFNIIKLFRLYNQYIPYEYIVCEDCDDCDNCGEFNNDVIFEQFSRANKNIDIPIILKDGEFGEFSHSYSFHIKCNPMNFSYIFEWNKNREDIRVNFINSVFGYANIDSLSSFLFEEAHKIYDYKTFTRFCKELRNFQIYYYLTTTCSEGELYTSITELELLNPENRKNRFNPTNMYHTINNAVRIGDIIDYFNLNIVVDDVKVLNRHIDIFKFDDNLYYYGPPTEIIPIPMLEYSVKETIENPKLEPFSFRKYNCEYNNCYSFVVNTGNSQIKGLVEWNYREACYKFNQDNNNIYFETPNSLVHHLIEIYAKDKLINMDQLIKECTTLINSIEKSSKGNTNLDYLICQINNPDEIECLIDDDGLPF